ncbi:XkdX family protein [Staphylococcus pseudintermedius]|nr:XkdX family protein [Staphylococcus pseudintermedius]PXA21465.1 XkdX family protein [Staphylococcus pseudintermedius]
MRNIGIKYYKMGLYTEKQFALFVKRGFVAEDELTGQNYQEVINE